MLKLRTTSLCILSLFCLSNIANAQNSLNNKTHGTVIDANGLPVMYASVSIVDTTYNLTLVHTATDTLGKFTIELGDVDLANATINIGHMSYEIYTATFTKQNKQLSIILKDRAVSANDVTVTAQKAAYTLEQGKINVDITQIKNYERLNVDKLLARIPGVSGSGASFTLYGTPATIYINGVKQTLSAEALEAYLSSLPASALANIELNAIPSGKYGKDVGAVIDIELDRKMPDGIVAQVEAKSGMAGNNLGDVGANAFFMMKKQNVIFNTVLSYDNEDIRTRSHDSTFYGTPDTYILNKLYENGRNNVITSTSNLMVDLGKGHLLDFNAFIYYDKGKITADWQDKVSLSTVFDEPWEYSKSNSTRNYDMYSATIKYSSPTKDQDHYVSAYYSGMYGGRRYTSDYFKLQNDAYNGFMSSDVGMVGHTHTFAVDATSKLNDKFSFDYGVQGDVNFLEDKANYFDFDDNSAISSSKYNLEEVFLASYLKFNYDITKRMGVSADVRYDYTNYSYNNHDGKGKQTSNYSDFTPNLSYWMSVPNYSLTLKLTSWLERPHFTEILPGERYVNDYFYTVGNPDLKPVTKYEITLQNRFWGILHQSIGFRRYENRIESVYFEDSENKSYSTFLNVGDLNYFTLFLGAEFDLFSEKLYGHVAGTMFILNYDNINPLITNYDPIVDGWQVAGVAKANIYYDITDRFTIDCSTLFNFNMRGLQSEKDFSWNFNASASYAFLPKEQLILSVEGTNLFDSADSNSSVNYGDNFSQRYASNYGPTVSLSLKYKFNKGNKIDYRDNTHDFSRMK